MKQFVSSEHKKSFIHEIKILPTNELAKPHMKY